MWIWAFSEAAMATKKRCFGPPYNFKYFGKPFGNDFQNKRQSFFEFILDADNDGSIIDNLLNTVAGKKNTGIVNVFGKMFNKK